MNVWEYIGNLQNDIGNDVKTTAVPAKNGRIPFGVTLDTAKVIPAKNGNPVIQTRFAPTRSVTNEDVERVRQDGIKALASVAGFFGRGIDLVVPESIQKKASKAMEAPTRVLLSGQQAVRSNYSFFRTMAEDNIAKGMVVALNTIASGVAGAITGAGAGAGAGALFGGIPALPGAAFGAITGFVIAAGVGGSRQRGIAKSGTLGREVKQAAIYAESAAGQEHYNFGRDATVQLARIEGFKPLGDTSMGVGAITSGLLNFGFEIATDPLLKGAMLGGRVAGSMLKGGVVPKSEGLLADKLGKITGIRELEFADRVEADIDELKKAGRGEDSIYSDLFEFLDNDAATIRSHPLFKDNDMGMVASSVLSGKSNLIKSLVLRIGRGDQDAMDELLETPEYADTLAEFNRYESGINALDTDGMIWFRHNNEVMMLGKKYRDSSDLIKAEFAALGLKKDFLQKTVGGYDPTKPDSADNLNMGLFSTLQTDRTVSPFAWVERQRMDKAVRATVIGLSGEKLGYNPLKWKERDISNSELIEGIRQESGPGKLMTSLYKNSMFATPMQIVHRATDDAPHATINFNEGVQSATRMRTSLRDAVRNGIMKENEAKETFIEFMNAVDENTKYNLIEKYAEKVIRVAAINANVHESVYTEAINKYLKQHRITKNEAATSQKEGRSFMIGLDGTAMEDPQLITQLANGSYLPDIPLIVNAFKEYEKKTLPGQKGIEATAYVLKNGIDELHAIWRGGTLARGGFVMNILRDANFRAWADMSVVGLYFQLGNSVLESMTNGLNSVKKISSLDKDILEPKGSLKKIRKAIDEREKTLKVLEGNLEAEGFYKKNKKGESTIQMTPYIERMVGHRDRVAATTKELRRQEAAILSNAPTKTVQKDKIIQPGWNFPASLSGQLGNISRQVLEGKEDIRGAVASIKELQMQSVQRGSYGLKAIQATENESAHLVAWNEMLTKHLANDPLSRKIMEGKSKPELMNWLQENGQRSYIDRFGLTVVAKGKPARKLTRDDSAYIYERVNYAVESLASNQEVRKLILNGKMTPAELVKLYPNVSERPPVSGDIITAAIGTSPLVKRFTVDLQKDIVTWLATTPTAKLNYNHYFAAKYYEKLESLVTVANGRGVIPNAANKLQFEKIARSYAINEYRSKINAFSKDMNFAGLMNYVIAFFPAVVEQFRAYGRIALDNPEFPIRLAYAAQIPEQIGNVQEDAYGNKYIEYTMPFSGLKARFGVDYFNPINPTGGSLLSAGPITTTVANLAAKRIDFADNKLGQFLLPFGVSTSNVAAFTPNTYRKAKELFDASLGNGEQLNRDKDMISKQYLYDFNVDNDGRQPTESELNEITSRGERDAFGLSVLRFLSSVGMPQQPKMRTAISYYEDRFNEAIKNDPTNGAENFFKNNPDYFMLAAKLNNPVSGINSDATAVALLKRNEFATREMVAAVGDSDLSALGAVFNDDNYTFSSAADAYLRTRNIPGLKQKFKDSEASLLNIKSAVVNKGWNEWYKLIQVVSAEIQKPEYNLDPARGLGETYLKRYKDAFIKKQETENPMWFKEKELQSGGGAGSRFASIIDTITIGANTPKMWKDLSQQPRWFAIAEYMNFRYSIYDELKRRDTSYKNNDSIDLRNAVSLKVWELRRKDIKFGQFYDRYFDGDDFSYVSNYTPPKRSK